MPTLGAREEDLGIDGIAIHTYVWGDPATQPYVLFAHGWSSHGTRVARWVQPLRDAGYAVVTFDQAAHGRSGGTHTTLPDFTCHLMAVAKHYGPAAAVIGHSLGGAATALALARGMQAGSAVLIAPAADPLAAVERWPGEAPFNCIALQEPWARRTLQLCARDFATLPGYAKALLHALTLP